MLLILPSTCMNGAADTTFRCITIRTLIAGDACSEELMPSGSAFRKSERSAAQSRLQICLDDRSFDQEAARASLQQHVADIHI